MSVRAPCVVPVLALVALALLSPPARAQAPAGPWDPVAAVLRSPAVAVAGGARFNFPRTDLAVRVGEVRVAPAIALGGWAGFASAAGDTMVMGDLVVTGAELPAVLEQLTAEGVAVTGVHNHLVGEEPRVLYVHYLGRGGAADLAARLERVLRRTSTPLPVTPARPEPVTIDTARLFAGLGLRGRASGAVAQVGTDLVGRPVAVGAAQMPGFAYGSPINVQAVSAERWVATGDFAVPAERTEPVIRALTSAHVLVTAVHSHMVGETPPLYFIHFWADGTPASVVAGIRGALDAAR